MLVAERHRLEWLCAASAVDLVRKLGETYKKCCGKVSARCVRWGAGALLFAHVS